jgi:hypothetical protein
MGSRPVAMIAVAFLALSAGTCHSDSDDAGPTSERTTTTASPEAEVETAYLAFWDMAVRLAESPDPNDPEIAQRASGDALAGLVDGLRNLQSLNRHSEFGPLYEHAVLAVRVDGDSAVVEDCAIDDSRIVDLESGEVVDESVVTEQLQVTLVRADNSAWRVDSSTRTNSWEGAVECE